jgi:SAM-dependent methyltransferase
MNATSTIAVKALFNSTQRSKTMTSEIATASPTVDFAAIKGRQQAAWSTGNYAVVGTTLQIVGENLAEAMDLRSGMRVLDVAAGNGNATLAAARRWCDVTSTDYVPALLESGRARAVAEGHTIKFQEADAENLPFANASYDAVMSTFGVMFTPNQERAASELLRVCKPGGKIGLANWTPDSFIGQLFKIIGRYIPPVAGIKSPSLWGTESRLAELFGPGAAPSGRRSANSCSAIARPRIGSRCSAPTTDRRTGRSRRWTPRTRPASPAISRT